MDEVAGVRRGATVDRALVEVEQWHRFVNLLLLLVQSGRLDAADGVVLIDALGHPPDVARGRRALFEIVRRHEPDACGQSTSG